MYPQELIDYLHDSPSALKVCSLVSHQFYPRTRVHLFRRVNYDNSKSARVFDIARDSPHLLQCIKRIQFRCLHFFLPKHHTAIVDLLHSLSSPVTLSIRDDSTLFGYSKEGCNWRHILPAFASSAPYLSITSLELISPQWHAFLEFHHIVLSLPNVTDLYLSGLEELAMNSSPAMPMPPAPRIRTMRVVDGDMALMFWEGLRSNRSVYLDHLEEFHVIDPFPGGTLSGTLPVSPSPLQLNTIADLRLGVELCDDTLPFINWWISSFKAVEKDSPVIELLTIKLADAECPISSVQLEALKRSFEELSEFLSKLVRNVDLVVQLPLYETQPSHFRNAIVDACEVLKEKTNLRVFDVD